LNKLITISLITTALLSNTIELDTLVITATKVSQNIKDTTSSAQVITKDEIKERRF